MLLRIGPSAAAATSIASSHSVPPTKSPRRKPAAGGALVLGEVRRPLGDVGAQATQDRLGGGGEVGPPRAQEGELDRGAQRGGVGLDARPRPRRPGGLETSTISSTEASASSRLEGGAGGEPADGGRQVATADAQGVGSPRRRPRSSRQSSCWQPVPDAATRPTGPGDVALAKPRPSPPTTAVPQSGPHDEHAPLAGGPLEGDLLLDGHVVAEDHHVATGVDGVHRLDQRARPGDRDEHQAVVGAAQGAGGRPRRCLLGARRRSAGASAPSAIGDLGARPRPSRVRRRPGGARRPSPGAWRRPGRRSPSARAPRG